MKKIIPVFVLPLLLAGCGTDIKEELGVKKHAPDEFTVSKKPKLEVPPEFKIRVPTPGEKAPNDLETREQTRQLLIGTAASSGDKSAGENALLKKSGATTADPKIRQTLNSEYGVEDPTTLERIRTISDKKAANTIVDPKAERERINDNKKQGKPATEGDVKTKASTKGSVIEKILGN